MHDSTSSNHLSTSFPNVQQNRQRKLSGGPNLMLQRYNSTRSQPNSPGQRRHSLQVASRPSSFTNLSHNLVSILYLSFKINLLLAVTTEHFFGNAQLVVIVLVLSIARLQAQELNDLLILEVEEHAA